jgi:murein DD-endopeptidase MepM/ murein hydrolase activator NlpD
MIRAGDIAVRLQLLSALREENARLKEQNQKLVVVAEKVNSLHRLSTYLERVATAVNEFNPAASPPEESVAARDRIYGEDSVDNIVEDIRLSESQHYRDLSDADVAAELLLGSIPNIRPVEGWITRTFDSEEKVEGRTHLGVDFAAAQGTLIRSTAPGTVDEVFHDKYFGLVVRVKHSYGFETRYGHCLQVLVSPGDVVERGQTIALVGNTGQSSGPHLHYEVLRNGTHVDPVKFMLSHAVLP